MYERTNETKDNLVLQLFVRASSGTTIVLSITVLASLWSRHTVAQKITYQKLASR